MNHFSIDLIPFGFDDYEENTVLPAHDLILQPLFFEAKECYIYGLKKDTDLFNKCTDVIDWSHNKYKLNLRKEVIKGYESLWNATGWRRGSIVVFIDLEEFMNLNIFSFCYDPSIWENPNSGESMAAIRFCKRKVEKDKVIGLCFSASNGIQYMKLYATEDILKSLYDKAVNESLNSNEDFLYKSRKKRRNLPK